MKKHSAETIPRDYVSSHSIMCEPVAGEAQGEVGQSPECQYCFGKNGKHHPNCRTFEQVISHIPEQYLRERLSFEYNERTSTFDVCGGGFVVAQAEDSEVANAICTLLNLLRPGARVDAGAHPAPELGKDQDNANHSDTALVLAGDLHSDVAISVPANPVVCDQEVKRATERMSGPTAKSLWPEWREKKGFAKGYYFGKQENIFEFADFVASANAAPDWKLKAISLQGELKRCEDLLEASRRAAHPESRGAGAQIAEPEKSKPTTFVCDCGRKLLIEGRVIGKEFERATPPSSPGAPQTCGTEYNDKYLDKPDSVHVCDKQKGHDGPCEDETMYWWPASSPGADTEKK